MLTCLWAGAPPVVHAANAIAGVATAVRKADFEIGTGVHDSAEHQGSKGDRALHQIPNGIGQVIAWVTRRDDGAAALVEQSQRSELFGSLPEGQKHWIIEGMPVYLI